MTFPEWTKPGLYGGLVGAVAVSFLGFSWGGWTTAAKAADLADALAAERVTQAMVPVCLDRAVLDPARAEKMAVLQDVAGYAQRDALLETGWVTLPGTDLPDRDLARACIKELDLNET